MNGLMRMVLFAAIVPAQVLAAAGSVDPAKKAYFDDRERGWFWYEQNEIEEEPEVKEEVEQPQTAIVIEQIEKPLSYSEMIELQGVEHKEALARAILNPSQENYADYMYRTQQIMLQSEGFANGLQAFTYTAPQYDTQINSGTNGQSKIVYNQAQDLEKEGNLAYIAQNYGLIFYFRSDCPYCHQYAPIVKRFAEKYDFSVLAISLDGAGLPEYPNPKYSPKMAQKLGVEVVPAVYLVNPSENKVITVGYGLSDFETLGNKVLSAYTNRNVETDLIMGRQ